MALDTVTLRINAVDFTGDENVTAYAVITPTRTVRDPDGGQVLVNQREFLPLGSEGVATIRLVATGQGEPPEWYYRIELWAVDEPARMDPASPTGYCVTRGLIELPPGDDYNLGDLAFVDQPDTEVTYPRLDELLAAINATQNVTRRAEDVLHDIRNTDLGTVVDDVSAIRDSAQAAEDAAQASADAAAFNVASVRDAAEAATAAVSDMSERMPENGARAVGKGELVINAADHQVPNQIADNGFNDADLRHAREGGGWEFIYAREGDTVGGAIGPYWYAQIRSEISANRNLHLHDAGLAELGGGPISVRPGATYRIGAHWSLPPVRPGGVSGYVTPLLRPHHQVDGEMPLVELGGTARKDATALGLEWEPLHATWTVPDGIDRVEVMMRWRNSSNNGSGVRVMRPIFQSTEGVAQSALDATPAGGTCYFPPGDYPVGVSPLSIPSNITIRGDGPGTRFVGETNTSFFVLPPRTENVTLRDVAIVGSMPADPAQQTRRHQVGIDAMEPSLEAPITNLRIEGCVFDGLEGFGIRLKHPQRLHIENNTFNRIGYAGIGTYSANQGSISHNTINGTGIPPPWQSNGNCYGVFLSFHEPDNNAGIPAPRPCDVTIHGNIVRNQAWECLDTHSGERISFVGNHLYDFPNHGIAVVGSGAQADGSFPYGATDAVIADNTVIGRGPGRTEMGIRLRGGAGAGAEWATGTITGNIVTWCGAHDDSNQYFGAIQLAFCRGTTVSNNVITEARSGAVVMHNCRSVVASGNSIVDVHRHDGRRASAFRLTRGRPESVDVMLVGNRLSRGGMELRAPVTNIADSAWFADPSTHVHTVVTSGNHWGFNPDIAFSSGVRTIAGAGLDYTETWGLAPPTWGSWSIGDRCWNQDPRANGMIGWVCTGGGSPGTWRPFGPVNLGQGATHERDR